MRIRAFSIAIAGLALGLSACATTSEGDADSGDANAQAPASSRTCVRTQSIRNYSALRDNQIRITATGNRQYDLDVTGPGCRDISFSSGIAIRADNGSSQICTDRNLLDTRIITRNQMGMCRVTRMTAVEPEADSDESDEDMR